MRGSAFMARSPLEVGDVVLCKLDGKMHVVEDILAIHSAAYGTVRFAYQLDNLNSTVSVDLIECRFADGRRYELSQEMAECREGEVTL